jgi:hypothetical protein
MGGLTESNIKPTHPQKMRKSSKEVKQAPAFLAHGTWEQPPCLELLS